MKFLKDNELDQNALKYNEELGKWLVDSKTLDSLYRKYYYEQVKYYITLGKSIKDARALALEDLKNEFGHREYEASDY